jgi:hypothetical protein
LEAAGSNIAPGNATTIARITDVLEHKGIQFVEGGVILAGKPRR